MELKYHPDTFRFLKKLQNKKRQNILGKIKQLEAFPEYKGLNLKKLAGTKRMWRLRIGDIRVILEIDMKRKIIYIHKIAYRAAAYK